VYNIFPFYLF